MSLKFWIGGAKSDKSRRMYKFILDEADKNPDRQYLVIVPEQFSLSTQQELVFNSKNHGILNIDVLSFSRLAHRIGDEVGSSMSDATTLDDLGKSLLIGMLAGRMKKELAVFGDDIVKLGYVDKIKSVISEFMQYGISVDKAYEMSKAGDDKGRHLLSEKLSDIANIYAAFREYIKDRFTTVEETLDTVCRLVPDSSTIKNSVVVFDGFTGFTPVQNKLIGVLMEYAYSVHVALLMEDCIQEQTGKGRIREHELFYLSKHTMDQLGRMADERHVVIEDPYKADKIGIDNTCNSEAEIAYTDNAQRSKLNNTSVRIFSGQNPDEEIRNVLARLLDLIRKEGYRYKDIAILAGDLPSYRHCIKRQFEKHGIPFFIDATEPILLNPFTEYIRSFIAIISENYSISSVFRFLKTGLAGFEPEEINILENYCLAANIKGYKAWHTNFTLKTGTAGEEELKTLNAIRERFVQKIDCFSPKTKINAATKRTVKEFSTALYEMIESDEIEDKLKRAAEKFEDEQNREAAAVYAGLYIKIMDVLDEMCELIPDEKTDIRGFGNLLDAGLDAIRIGIVPLGMDYIQVGDLMRSRIGNVKALFIIGANDGIIPKASQKTGIISDSEKEFLTGSDDKLVLSPGAKEEIYTQQLYIYMATNKPSDILYVSYCRASSSGKAMLPSYIIRKLLNENDNAKIENTSLKSLMDEEEAFAEMTDLIYPALSGTISNEDYERLREFIRYFGKNDKYKERLKTILQVVIYEAGASGKDSIGSALAHAIYGKHMDASITRLENYAKCAYSYFLKYGLALKEREIFSFEAKDMGNIFHDSMKEYSKLVADCGYDWVRISPKEREDLMDKAVDNVMETYRTEKLSSSARYAYMEQRIRRIMKKSAIVISDQLEKGKFVPKYFEIDFDTLKGNETISMRLSDEDMLRLRGRIDRIDTCETEDGIYVRVIDYKSSKHDVDFAAVYEGRQLQLLVYLGVARSIENSKKVISAGTLYYHIDDPIITAEDELGAGDIKRLFMKDRRLNGLVNSDTDILKMSDEHITDDSTVLDVSFTQKGNLRATKQAVPGETLEMITEYVTECIKKMGRDILAGNIAVPEPDQKTRFTGPDCSYCPFDAICLKKVPERSKEKAPKDVEYINLMRKKDETDS